MSIALVIALLIGCTQQIAYTFTASKNYLLVECTSPVYQIIRITVYSNEIKQLELTSGYDQYLYLYYKIKSGTQYDLDIVVNPQLPLNITEVASKDCPNRCSNNGVCQLEKCHCADLFTGYGITYNTRDRCQYAVQPIYSGNFTVISLIPYEVKYISLYFKQSELKDSQGYMKQLSLSSSVLILAKLYFLLPFEYPSEYITDDNLIMDDILYQSTSIDFSDQYESYRLSSALYSFVLMLNNTSTNNTLAIYYSLVTQDQPFQDYILIAILSVIAFIILLIVIYVIRRRCQYITINKMKLNQQEQSSQNLVLSMPVVRPAKEQECIICLDSLDTQVCRQTPCKHVLHESCLAQWLIKQQTCPLCREPLTNEDELEVNQRSLIRARMPFSGGQSTLIGQTDRNTVRHLVLQRTHNSRLAVYQ